MAEYKQRVYHGSPNVWKGVIKPSADFLNTGEGGQVYAGEFYAAASPEIARKRYMERLELAGVPTGEVYGFDIDPDKFIDMDKPLSKQSKFFMDRLVDYANNDSKIVNQILNDSIPARYSVYQDFVDELQIPREKQKALTKDYIKSNNYIKAIEKQMKKSPDFAKKIEDVLNSKVEGGLTRARLQTVQNLLNNKYRTSANGRLMDLLYPYGILGQTRVSDTDGRIYIFNKASDVPVGQALSRGTNLAPELNKPATFGNNPYAVAQPHFTPRQIPNLPSMANKVMTRLTPTAMVLEGITSPLGDGTLTPEQRSAIPVSQFEKEQPLLPFIQIPLEDANNITLQGRVEKRRRLYGTKK